MPNPTAPAAAPGLPIVIPFPTDRARAPDPAGRLYDKAGFDHSFLATNVAGQFVDAPDEAVRAMLRCEGDGATALARILEHNRQAIAFLRAALANLIMADRRISAAADRVLAEAGL